MFTLYFSPGSASWVVHWLLIDLELPHQLRRLDLSAGQQKSTEYLALNPQGVVPTMLVDGQPVWETAGLLLHLADLRPQAGLAPAVGSLQRARYYQWMTHLSNGLQPWLRHWFYPQEAAGSGAEAEAKHTAGEAIEAHFNRLERALHHGPYLLGNSPTAADFLLTMLMRWSRNMPRPATSWPSLARLAAHMKARPSFALLNEREGLTEWT